MNHAFAGLFFAGSCLVACAPGAGSPKAAEHGTFGKVEGRLDAERWLSRDTERAKRAGARPAEVVAVDAGTVGDRVSGLLNVPDDECVLLLARASDDVDDIDLFAYGDDGTLLGSDERPDKSPAVLVCPPHPRRMYVSARVAAGHGLVAVGAQRVATRDAATVGRVLAARGAPGDGGANVDAWVGLDERVLSHQKSLGSSWREVRRSAVPLDSAIGTRLSTVVDENRCLDVLVVPSDDVSHLDVALLLESGRIAGRAVARARDRFLVACTRDKATLTVEIRPQSGRGFAAVVISESREPSPRAVESDVPVIDLAPLTPLRDALAKTASDLEGQSYALPKKLGDGTLSIGRRESVALKLPAGCARLDVVGGKPLSGVEAWLWSSNEDLIAHDKSTGHAVLFACGSGGRARLDVEAQAQSGPYAAEMRAFREAPKALVDHPLAANRLLTRMLARGVVRRADQVTAPKVVQISASHREALDVIVPIGRCVDVTLALGPGASGAEVRLVNKDGGSEVDRAYGTSSAAARACALAGSGTLAIRAELRAQSGAGEALAATRMLAPRD
jgi:hypothetical protein